MVLHLSEQDHVSFTNKFPGPCLGHQVDALSSPTGENDFFRARCADVVRNTPPRVFVSFCRSRTQRMQTTMNVCVLMLIVGPKRLNDGKRFLGGGRAIEID